MAVILNEKKMSAMCDCRGHAKAYEQMYRIGACICGKCEVCRRYYFCDACLANYSKYLTYKITTKQDDN